MKVLRKPHWFKRKFVANEELGKVISSIRQYGLHTVCHEARCPNINYCFSQGQATFLILGDVCTRSCRFCAINKGKPKPLDFDEPERVAKAAKKMNLSYVVVTSVTRDDIVDGGASIFAMTIDEIRRQLPESGIEVLTPDFMGKKVALDTVLSRHPDVFNHNVETIPRLYPIVRPQANYARSLNILSYAAKNYDSLVKSGFMVGLGETDNEIYDLMRDLRNAGVQVVTIGQYLQPSPKHLPIERFVTPEKFAEYAEYGERELGFVRVFSGPLVRSSFMAQEIWKRAREKADAR